jgi:tetratricopeptide (TPR) repeat protein
MTGEPYRKNTTGRTTSSSLFVEPRKTNRISNSHQNTGKSRGEGGIGRRVALGLIAFAVLGAQVFYLTRDPRYQCVIAFVLYAALLLWLRRKSPDVFVERRQTGILKLFQFPGYLLLLSALALVSSFWYRSLSIASVASVLYFGWWLGRRRSPQACSLIAPPWMMLFLICIASSFQSEWPTTVGALLLDATSGLLDRWNVLHVADSKHFHLLDPQQAIPVEMNGWLSRYCFFGMAVAIMVTTRQAFLQGLLNLIVGVLISFLLPAMRIISAVIIHRAGFSSGIEKSELLLTGLTFLIGGILFLSCSGLISFCFGAIAFPQDGDRSIGRLSALWNRWVGFQASRLLASDGRMLYSKATGTPTTGRSLIFRWAKEYAATRRWWKLLAGLPILILVAYLSTDIVDIAGVRNLQPNALLARYAEPFTESVKNKEFAKSKLIAQRLKQLDPFQKSYAYDLANAQVASGDVIEGENVIRDLIAIHPQDTEAHAWLAKRCLMRGFANPEKIDLSRVNRTEIDEAEKHFRVLLELEPKNWEARAAYAAILASKSETAAAVNLLNQHKSASENEEIQLIRLMAQLQQHEEAAVRARGLVALINRQKPDSLEMESTLILAEAQQRSGNAADGMETLMSAFDRFGGDPQIRQPLVACGIEVCRSLNPLLQSDQVLQCLKQIEGIDSESADLAVFIARLAFVHPDNSKQPLARYCRDFLKRGIANEKLPHEAFVILGTGAAQRGKMEVALRYLQLSYDRGVRSSALLNNLAWVVTQRDKPDLQLALKYVNEALEVDRRSHDALLTRADIFMQLDRYTEAIVDLEQVHLQRINLKQVRSRLADCYRAIGETEIEADLRKLLKEADQSPKLFPTTPATANP